jgi:dTDP-4-dehydrorhamnose reductase
MKEKIAVVSGASSGAISAIIDRLLKTGYMIVAVSRFKQEDECREGIKWIQCDLSVPNQDFSFLTNADILIHAAAISYTYSLDEYLQNNYQSTIHLVDASKKFGVKKFVYISSILAGYECGDYALSKIKSEEYVKQGMADWLIFRPSQLYGYTLSNPIDKLINSIEKKKIIICPVGDKKGISPLYYKEFSQLVFDSIISIKETKITKELSGQESFTYIGLVKEIIRVLNLKRLIIKVPRFLIMLVFRIIRLFHLRLGIYPDQFYRFYNNHTIEVQSTGSISIAEYLTKKRE